jgi:hypothetical protein
MPQVILEPTIPVFEGAKAVHALDHGATVIYTDQWFSTFVRPRAGKFFFL